MLAQPTAEMETLRGLLTVDGRFPCRRTWERRLTVLPDTLPAQIGCLGRTLVTMLKPWAHCGRAAAVDSTVLRARGGVWHAKHRAAGVVPHTSIDTEAAWTKSGWHGWVYGWKLHLITTVAAVWIPLAAELTPANTADNEQALRLLSRSCPVDGALCTWTTPHYNAPAVRAALPGGQQELVATRHGSLSAYGRRRGGAAAVPHPALDGRLRTRMSSAKVSSTAPGQVPTKGLRNTRRWALGAVLVYQLKFVVSVRAWLGLRVGLKPFLKAA